MVASLGQASQRSRRKRLPGKRCDICRLYRTCPIPRNICKAEVEGVCVAPLGVQGICDAVLPCISELRQVQRNREEIHEVKCPVNEQVTGIGNGIVYLSYSVALNCVLVYPVVEFLVVEPGGGVSVINGTVAADVKPHRRPQGRDALDDLILYKLAVYLVPVAEHEADVTRR